MARGGASQEGQSPGDGPPTKYQLYSQARSDNGDQTDVELPTQPGSPGARPAPVSSTLPERRARRLAVLSHSTLLEDASAQSLYCIPFFINVLISFHKWNAGLQMEKVQLLANRQTWKPPGLQEAR